MGVVEEQRELEVEYARTQKNKNTEYHLGRLKAKMAKLRRELLDPGTKGPKGEGFAVQKHGNARVSLVGFPSVGKSSLLSLLTPTESKTSHFEFTTLTCVPGVLKYNDAVIQLLDLPGIIEGAAHGKGNGRQVLAVAKASDVLLIMLEPSKGVEQMAKIKQELDDMGIRINRRPPNMHIRECKTGGVKLNSTVKQTHLDEKLCYTICQEYKRFNLEIVCREDNTVDDLIDTIEGNRKYVDAIFVYNKCDTISVEDIDEIARRPNSCPISVYQELNMDYLLEMIWDRLDLVRVYTKKRGDYPDFNDPIIMTQKRKGTTIEAVCEQIHKEFAKEFKYALVWGRSAKFSPQNCGLNHEQFDEDVIQIFSSTKKASQPKPLTHKEEVELARAKAAKLYAKKKSKDR